MELFTAFFVIVTGFAVLGAMAAGFGVDTRSTYADDWTR